MTKIAIIEDDQAISQMYRMKFEADGFDVQIANNGARGVAMVENFLPDIILMDLQLPEMNGVEALTTIRKNDWGKKIPVIILTNMEEDSLQEVRSLGVESYIIKANMTPRQVVQKIKQVLKI